MIALILAAALAVPPQLPDPKLTPGAVNPAATLSAICVKGYTAGKGVRNVTEATKRKVMAEYGYTAAMGPTEIDHLISLELGGSNDIKNLWPEAYRSTPWNAHLKDAVEDRLHADVCHGAIPLAQAQHDISTDWIGLYKRLFPAALPKGTTP